MNATEQGQARIDEFFAELDRRTAPDYPGHSVQWKAAMLEIMPKLKTAAMENPAAFADGIEQSLARIIGRNN